MFETNLLTAVINECAKLSVRKDKEHYRLDLLLYKNKIYNLDLNDLLSKITNECKFYYDVKNNKYYLHGKNAIKALELLEQLNVIDYYVPNEFNNKVAAVLNNKELFTRSSGKKRTKDEVAKLEELYLSV